MRLTKITFAQNEVLLRYHGVRRLYFRTVIFVATLVAYHRRETDSQLKYLYVTRVNFTRVTYKYFI